MATPLLWLEFVMNATVINLEEGEQTVAESKLVQKDENGTFRKFGNQEKGPCVATGEKET